MRVNRIRPGAQPDDQIGRHYRRRCGDERKRRHGGFQGKLSHWSNLHVLYIAVTLDSILNNGQYRNVTLMRNKAVI